MKQVPIDKYNIAWFKLAECVSRGEKERALGMYRLLSHSFDDVAFARQLEGDILWSFNDSGAADKYHQAAQLYQKDARILQAAAIYEHLITLHPDSVAYVQGLVEVYTALSSTSKVILYVMKLIELLLAKREFGAVDQALELLLSHGEYEKNLYAQERLLIALCKDRSVSQDVVQARVQALIDTLVMHASAVQVQSFLHRLEVMHSAYYEFACVYLESKK